MEEAKESHWGCKGKDWLSEGHRLIIKDTARFVRLVEENKDKSSIELAKLWDEPVSSKSVLRLLKKLGYSYKKNFCASQKGGWSKD